VQNDREYLYEALDYVAKGRVRVMTESFPLDDMNVAYEKVVKGELRFRAVLKIQ
jgi:D-arabinose 1-dehydrogenase-like Zn-dependent alcohol dehydrogenase